MFRLFSANLLFFFFVSGRHCVSMVSTQTKNPTASDFGHFHAIFETSKVGSIFALFPKMMFSLPLRILLGY